MYRVCGNEDGLAGRLSYIPQCTMVPDDTDGNEDFVHATSVCGQGAYLWWLSLLAAELRSAVMPL